LMLPALGDVLAHGPRTGTEVALRRQGRRAGFPRTTRAPSLKQAGPTAKVGLQRRVARSSCRSRSSGTLPGHGHEAVVGLRTSRIVLASVESISALASASSSRPAPYYTCLRGGEMPLIVPPVSGSRGPAAIQVVVLAGSVASAPTPSAGRSNRGAAPARSRPSPCNGVVG